MEMCALVTKLLGPAQEIVSSTGSPVHVQRWTVFRSKFFDVCLDRCAGQYENSDRCNERDRFVSIGLGEAHTPDDIQMIASFDDKAWMVMVRRHSGSVQGKAA
jgi:hypothetical protein